MDAQDNELKLTALKLSHGWHGALPKITHQRGVVTATPQILIKDAMAGLAHDSVNFHHLGDTLPQEMKGCSGSGCLTCPGRES